MIRHDFLYFTHFSIEFLKLECILQLMVLENFHWPLLSFLDICNVHIWQSLMS